MTRGLAILLVFGILVSGGILIWLNQHAVTSWEESAKLLTERRAREAADLLFRAFTRDMMGAQTSILASPEWDEFTLSPPYDVRTMVSSAFARYPYPESFFGWRENTGGSIVFFNRPDQLPEWMPAAKTPVRFPVLVEENPPQAAGIVERIRKDAQLRRTFSIFETAFGSTRYQIVARLLYGDALRTQLQAVFGFTVNLKWVKEHYFKEVIRQVSLINEERFDLAVVDEKGTMVAGTGTVLTDANTISRTFPLSFFDPQIVGLDTPTDFSRPTWTIAIDVSDDPSLKDAVRNANKTRIIAAAAALALGIGLVLTVRAGRASERLAEMRNDFVSTVTHELKTPIATIRAIGDTLLSGRVTGVGDVTEYAGLLVQESKRLERLVENLLAFARVTDVTEVYTFEAIEVDSLIERVLKNFRTHFGGDFELSPNIPSDLPAISGDRTALELMLDNLVDNAIRYSPKERWLAIDARNDGQFVSITVSDHGIGIPPDELEKVTRKFFRGKQTRMSGTGLGLAIVRRILQDHGGVFSIQSEVDVGTHVTVRLPIAKS
jgi:signal transduction histidine kinase